MHHWKNVLAAQLAVVGLACAAPAPARPIALTGATLVDVSEAGRAAKDIAPATVIIDADRIVYAGPSEGAPLPAGAQQIDARGKFLVPGLIEGFGSLQSQGFANAYLYEGVTAVFLADPGKDERRGPFFEHAAPGPRVLLGDVIAGYVSGPESPFDSLQKERLEGVPLTHAQISARLEQFRARGVRCVLIDYDTWPDQVDHIVREARRLGLGTIGEIGFTSYPYAARAGVGAFVHSQKYLTELVPFDVRLAWSDDPFGPPGRAMNEAIWALDPAAPEVARWGKFLAKSRSYLMPTEALSANGYAGFPRENPWLRPAAALVAPDQLHRPLDRTTGEPPPSTAPQAYRDKALAGTMTELALDRRFHEEGARFLAASGSSAFGTLPGGGMHQEMRLLVQYVGLTPREALAAATSNYADALGFTDLGQLSVGRKADLLVLGADPRLSIEAIEHIEIVIAQGQVLDRPALLRWKVPAEHAKVESP